VVRDSKLDWFPDVNASFDPAYVTPSGIFSPKGHVALHAVIDLRVL
jgi:hypothetical protein